MGTILMFAVALNLRPNMGIVPFVLLMRPAGACPSAMRCWLGIATVALFFVGTMAVVHLLYPAYSYASFLNGLAQYGMAYAGGRQRLCQRLVDLRHDPRAA